jgi:type IV fimbrial biogenesis protein FimT
VSNVKDSREKSFVRSKPHLFQQLTSSQRMTGAVNSLVTTLHLARNEAITRRERAVLCPSVEGRTCRDNSANSTAWEDGYLLYIDHNANSEFDADDTLVWVASAIEGLHIRSSAHRDHVTFLASGMASGTNVTFTFCDKGGRSMPRAVVVSNSGRPRASTRGAGGSAIVCPAAS